MPNDRPMTSIPAAAVEAARKAIDILDHKLAKSMDDLTRMIAETAIAAALPHLARPAVEPDNRAEYTDEALAAVAIDFLEAKATAWMEETKIQGMFNAVASVFEQWAPQDVMDRFREKLGAIGHLCFVEGAMRAWSEISAERGEVGERIASITTDWNGARMVDGEEPRIIPTCGELRALATTIAALAEEVRTARETAIQETLAGIEPWLKMRDERDEARRERDAYLQAFNGADRWAAERNRTVEALTAERDALAARLAEMSAACRAAGSRIADLERQLTEIGL